MVLGLRSKNRKSPSIQVDYLIHVQDIKPWPPSQSLRTLRAVVLQWEHGNRSSGCTNQVVPSLGTGSGVGDGRIEFNESFRLPVTLLREISVRGGDGDSFQKNCIEFNLYEPRRDKAMKGQLLGTALIDFADYGAAKDTLSISAPINCKRSYRNTAQPLLFLKIQPIEKSHGRSLSRDSLTRNLSMDRNSAESVSKLMNEEYAEEAEVASFTDDDVSSHSSLAVSSAAIGSNGSSPCQSKQNGSGKFKDSIRDGKVAHVLVPKVEAGNPDKEATESLRSLDGSSSRSSSIDLSSDLAWISRKIGGVQSSSNVVSKECESEQMTGTKNNLDAHEPNIKHLGLKGACEVLDGLGEAKNTAEQGNEENASNSSSRNDIFLDSVFQVDKKLNLVGSVKSDATRDHENTLPHSSRAEHLAIRADANHSISMDNENRERSIEREQEEDLLEEMTQFGEENPMDGTSLDSTLKQASSDSIAPFPRGENSLPRKYTPAADTTKSVKSVRSAVDLNRSNELLRNSTFVPTNGQYSFKGPSSTERKNSKVYPKEMRNSVAESKILKLEGKVNALERELREAAALEVALYSVVAEHGSSSTKVHAPARRLSRFYLHASREDSPPRRGSAAKSSVSGLVLVAKACGNDVPRLTFWLSNSIVLRAIVNKSFEGQMLPVSSGTISRGANNSIRKNMAALTWGTLLRGGSRSALDADFDDWEDPRTFSVALEKVEAWIFSRIIESIWWQTLTPHMQSGAAKEIRRSVGPELNKVCRRTSSSGEEEQTIFALELWKRAFKDACERICPVRAAGHECGCLPVLSQLIMEQCVARLDVAMFNAILRESADEIPTDPISDPISDAEVLPILPGKASFGAGAQLKNAIGNWSRWLTDLFGIDDGDSLGEEHSVDYIGEDIKEQNSSTKSFHLLNALSDLMMLPKDMLLSRTIRKEVCPSFDSQVLRRVLNAFVPDEFCPDPVPEVVLEALNSEDTLENEQDSAIKLPCVAAPILYMPPSAVCAAGLLSNVGDQSQLGRSGSWVLKKPYTSDDELEELDSPVSSIVDTLHASPSSAKPCWTPKEWGNQNTVRYRLLREVWMKN